MRILPRRGALTALLLIALLALVGVGARRAAHPTPPGLEQLGIHHQGGHAAMVVRRVPGLDALDDRFDGPPLPAGLPAAIPPLVVATWWLARPPSPSARSGRARRGAAPRAPPAAPFLV
jgi:hypothetical protein